MEVMAKPNPFDGARAFIVKGGMPVTMVTIGAALVTFVAWWLTNHSEAWYPLLFSTSGWLTRPWSLVTYAFVEGWFPTLVCGGLMAFFFMGALERAWPRERFLPAYFIMLFAPPLALWIGSLASGVPLLASGLWLPAACWVVAFGAYRPEATILLMAIVPVKAKWLAWIAGLTVVFITGTGAPIAGVCAGLAPLAAWGLATRRISFPLPKKKEKPFADEFRKSMKTKRESEAERLRLRKLLEESIDEDES